MNLKQEPIDIDTESSNSPRVLSAHSDRVTPMMTSPCPVNFLTERAGSEVILDPMQEDVVFLPHRAPRSRGHHRHRTREVTEYANYTISHLEAEVNSKHLPKKYRCRFCIYKTSYKSDLNRHLRKHGIAPRHCPLCNMPFKTTGNLENHIRQAHLDVAENMGIMPSSLSTMCMKGVFVPPVAMGSPPGLMNLPTGSHAVQLSAADPDEQALQLHKDFPALSQAVLSPAQLNCHMCPFVCSDSQVLARHILTHPGEEEVSRTTQSSHINVADTKHACHRCGKVLASVDELQVHRHSCVINCEAPSQSKESRKPQSEDKSNVDKTKRNGKEVGNKHGLPRQETMNKLRSVITNQSEGSYSSSEQKEKSMTLPHIPANEVNSEKPNQKENESSAVYTVSEPSRSDKVTDNQEQFNLYRSADEDRLSRRKENYGDLTFRGTVKLAPSKDKSQLITGDNQQSKIRPENKKQDREAPPRPLQLEGRQSSVLVSNDDRDPKHYGEVSSKETPDHHESVSYRVKRVNLSPDCRTSVIKPSGKNQPGKQNSPKAVSVKEEPQSPDACMEFEGFECNKSYEEDSKTDPSAARLDSATSTSSCERHEHECSLCDQPFKDRAHLFLHTHHVHIQTSASTSSSVRTRSAVPSSLSDHTCSLPKSQNRFHSYHTSLQDEETTRQSPPRQVNNQSIMYQPPSRGRYAKLVSDFDDFASKPYACSLCFFRTARLSELSVHVHNHLTGGSSTPPTETASFQPRASFYVERGTSPWKRDSEDLAGFKSVVLSGSSNSSTANAICGNTTGFNSSRSQSVITQPNSVEHSEGRVLSSQESDDQTFTTDVTKSSSVPDAVSNTTTTSNSCHHSHTKLSTNSPEEDHPSVHSPQTVEMNDVVPNVTTTVLSDDDVIVSLNRDDLSEVDEISSTGYGDTVTDSDTHLQADKIQEPSEPQNISRAHPSSFQYDKDPLVNHDLENARDVQKISSPGVTDDVPVALNSKNVENDVLHKTEDTFLKPPHPSSEKSTLKICCRTRPRIPKMTLPQRGKHDGNRRLSKNRKAWWQSGKAKTGQRCNSVSKHSYRCVHCEQSFSLRQLLSRHVRYVHPVSVASPAKEV